MLKTSLILSDEDIFTHYYHELVTHGSEFTENQLKYMYREVSTFNKSTIGGNTTFPKKIYKNKAVYFEGKFNRTKQDYRAWMLERYAPRCVYCGNKESLVIDHIFEKSVYTYLAINPLNLCLACSDCNTSKNAEFTKTSVCMPLSTYSDFGNFAGRFSLTANVEVVKYFDLVPQTSGNELYMDLQLGDRIPTSKQGIIMFYFETLGVRKRLKLRLNDTLRTIMRLLKKENDVETAVKNSIAEITGEADKDMDEFLVYAILDENINAVVASIDALKQLTRSDLRQIH